ncbi:transglycosylase SLT domain-containing protein [Pseudomonas syringae pv. syringae]|uniref:transglycosylase SLT domain-containing protein n=1 Tax=Pseudomonas syringae TaxID=317 RepID=UPI00200B3186|nr:transglycosylase SLT domain-containing protein [Pseudomonas syringae]MCK9749749.1 transglycosylase SLT domain-containing protein [Pseudomonas syringae pv. syringae]MCK9754019.1 transglycosylase SLT domain-containing protein [Pseudomonas syringae pv. syringae]
MAASVTWAGLAPLCFALTSHAAELPPPAYQLAAHAANIPSEVLYSLALQESGTPLRGQLVPWPWTLNVAGASYRFATRADACTALIIALAQAGPKRVDVGLGQVNMGWNGQRFKSSNPCEALNPYKNLDVAAQMLAELRALGGDWITVAGRYHRPAGGAPAANYRKAFAKHLSRVTGIQMLVTNP